MKDQPRSVNRSLPPTTPAALTRERIAEIRRLEAEATAGPWKTCDCSKLCRAWPEGDADYPVLDDACRRDRDLIVALRNAASALLDAAEERDKLRDRREALRVQCLEPDMPFREAMIRCRICARTWTAAATERHAPDCIAAPLAAPEPTDGK